MRAVYSYLKEPFGISQLINQEVEFLFTANLSCYDFQFLLSYSDLFHLFQNSVQIKFNLTKSHTVKS